MVRAQSALLVAVAVACSIACRDAPSRAAGPGASSSEQRYREIEETIRDNLVMGAHFQRAVGRRTIDAVVRDLRPGDLPLLVAAVSDDENIVRIGAVGTLKVAGDYTIIEPLMKVHLERPWLDAFDALEGIAERYPAEVRDAIDAVLARPEEGLASREDLKRLRARIRTPETP